jgi:hypothetical protein
VGKVNGKEVNFDINTSSLSLSDVRWARENLGVLAQ